MLLYLRIYRYTETNDILTSERIRNVTYLLAHIQGSLEVEASAMDIIAEHLTLAKYNGILIQSNLMYRQGQRRNRIRTTRSLNSRTEANERILAHMVIILRYIESVSYVVVTVTDFRREALRNYLVDADIIDCRIVVIR